MSSGLVPAACLFLTFLASPGSAGSPPVTFLEKNGKIEVHIKDRPFATYVYKDEKVPRPYFMHLYAPNGLQVTRNHPPRAGQDATDHDTFHPGAWLAFGDIGGHDTWRNKARVVLDKWEVVQGAVVADRAHFKVQCRYLPKDSDGPFAREESMFTVIAAPLGHILLWEARIHPLQKEIAFGDQEEMGLGIRVATPLTVKNGGRIINSKGHINEKGAWGKIADWCEYSKVIEGKRIGVAILADARNFQPSYFHVRDYGLMAANAFGRKTFTQQPSKSFVLKPSQKLQLRYAIVAFATAEKHAVIEEAFRLVFP